MEIWRRCIRLTKTWLERLNCVLRIGKVNLCVCRKPHSTNLNPENKFSESYDEMGSLHGEIGDMDYDWVWNSLYGTTQVDLDSLHTLTKMLDAKGTSFSYLSVYILYYICYFIYLFQGVDLIPSEVNGLPTAATCLHVQNQSMLLEFCPTCYLERLALENWAEDEEDVYLPSEVNVLHIDIDCDWVLNSLYGTTQVDKRVDKINP